MLIPIIRWTILGLIAWGVVTMCSGCVAPVWANNLVDTVERVASAATQNADAIRSVGNAVKAGVGDEAGSNVVAWGGIVLGIVSILNALGVGKKAHERISRHKRENQDTIAGLVAFERAPSGPPVG